MTQWLFTRKTKDSLEVMTQSRMETEGLLLMECGGAIKEAGAPT